MSHGFCNLTMNEGKTIREGKEGRPKGGWNVKDWG
jgi:hypothetical protein